ncbi:MAG: hypothetical protein NZM94_08975 [Roseiflexus sp.]|nr:hypothetical protein [Roseiflexus sp.]
MPSTSTLESVAERQTRLRPTLDQVYITAALMLIALRPLLTPIPPHDFWWHMATGRIILETGTIPQVDMFSYTRTGEPFFNQGWLAQLLMALLHQIGGLPLIIIVQALVLTLAYGLLLRLCILRTNRVRMCAAILLLATLPLSFDNWTVRPQTYVFPLFAGFLTVLTEYRFGTARRLWLLPLLMALWVNMHGSFVLGFALISIMFAGEAIRRWRDQGTFTKAFDTSLLVWGAATAVATLLNPRGVEVLGYVTNLLGSSQVTDLVTEWSPPTIRDINGAIFFLFVIVTALVLIYARSRPDLTDLLLLGAFLWLALGATRNIVWLGFVATPLLATQAATLLPPPSPRRFQGVPAMNAALIGLLAVLLLIGSPWIKPALLPPEVGALLAKGTPVEATRALQELPQRPQRLFHAMSYGSYLIWAAPDQKVFIDPRIELYPYDQWRDYILLGQGADVEVLLTKYAIDSMMLSVEEQKPLLEYVRARPDQWREVYANEETVVLVRVGG